MTANQALLLIVYHFYGCPVNYFVMVQTFIYSYTHVDQIFGATQKLKNQRQKKECLEYFFNTKTEVCRRFDFEPLRLKKKRMKIINGKTVQHNKYKPTVPLYTTHETTHAAHLNLKKPPTP